MIADRTSLPLLGESYELCTLLDLDKGRFLQNLNKRGQFKLLLSPFFLIYILSYKETINYALRLTLILFAE